MVQSPPVDAGPVQRPLSRLTVAVLTCAVGGVVANLYYAQPLESRLTEAFGVTPGAIGLALTVIQLGYALGLATLVPLGDLVERRRLLVPLLTVATLGLATMALTGSFPVFVAAGAVLGVCCVVVQMLVPFAADLAPAERRGRVVSTVMSGLLIGVLLSRTVSGLISGTAGWRAVFWFAAGLTAALTALLWWRLPRVAPRVSMSYGQLLGSVVRIVREEPVLRLRMLYGDLCFASFGVFWTSAGFLLAGGPYHWGTAAIGAFALVGVAGAAAARYAGTLADRGWVNGATGAFLLITTASYGLIQLGHTSVAALVAGVALMDLGCQGVHISNQSIIYALRPDARSRINTAYMTSYFLAGSLGSAVSAVLYPRFGWAGVTVAGLLFPAVGLAVWTSLRLRLRAATAVAPS